MPTLLEVQRAVARTLIDEDDPEAAQLIVADGMAPEARLNVYRNTFVGVLTSALRLSFPAVHRLVGAGFFETAARLFVEADPPRTAYLDEYGADFPVFLDRYAPAASVPYLAGVARLEWAVSRALHAPDSGTLDVAALSRVDAERHGLIAFMPHPSAALVRADHPVDAIWRAVLAQDDRALAAIDPGDGPVWLLVHRGDEGVEVTRCPESAWLFTQDLFSSRPLGELVQAHRAVDASTLLAGHLVSGRIGGFQLVRQPEASIPTGNHST